MLQPRLLLGSHGNHTPVCASPQQHSSRETDRKYRPKSKPQTDSRRSKTASCVLKILDPVEDTRGHICKRFLFCSILFYVRRMTKKKHF